MALIVEDGTGKADAESYIAVADATTYHANRGNTAWSALASDTVREQLLRQAADFMVQEYRARWAGSRIGITQRLDWPRYDVPIKDAPTGYGTFAAVYPYDEVPEAVRNACAELALKAASGPLRADVTPPVVREKVGPLEVEYAEGARQTTVYLTVDNMLEPFFKDGGGTIPVVRA
jgi:hypothetical protein